MDRSPNPMPPTADAPLRWWRVPMVWLVISGPAVVVVASFLTLALAIVYPDHEVPQTAAKAPPSAPTTAHRPDAAPGR